MSCVTAFETRREYIPVGSTPASMLVTVSKAVTQLIIHDHEDKKKRFPKKAQARAQLIRYDRGLTFLHLKGD